ncbi:hypothetical protein [Enterocloster phage PMBT24]|uniref:Uncharacterized protein n=1 Tax=Enterocloster phage PMBT24 TaxID=3025413 RepID=A0AAT9TS54_9CAUD|nr:hypothetical protein [Enterocloster phage PMBT24]DAL90012.1 MAG TPA: hypothetical protein [Caudoviricetes sp.]
MKGRAKGLLFCTLPYILTYLKKGNECYEKNRS